MANATILYFVALSFMISEMCSTLTSEQSNQLCWRVANCMRNERNFAKFSLASFLNFTSMSSHIFQVWWLGVIRSRNSNFSTNSKMANVRRVIYWHIRCQSQLVKVDMLVGDKNGSDFSKFKMARIGDGHYRHLATLGYIIPHPDIEVSTTATRLLKFGDWPSNGSDLSKIKMAQAAILDFVSTYCIISDVRNWD